MCKKERKPITFLGVGEQRMCEIYQIIHFKVWQEIKCYFYIFAHDFLNISAVVNKDIVLWRKHDEYFEDKGNGELCIVFSYQGRQKMHLLFVQL